MITEVRSDRLSSKLELKSEQPQPLDPHCTPRLVKAASSILPLIAAVIAACTVLPVPQAKAESAPVPRGGPAGITLLTSIGAEGAAPTGIATTTPARAPEMSPYIDAYLESALDTFASNLGDSPVVKYKNLAKYFSSEAAFVKRAEEFLKNDESVNVKAHWKIWEDRVATLQTELEALSDQLYKVDNTQAQLKRWEDHHASGASIYEILLPEAYSRDEVKKQRTEFVNPLIKLLESTSSQEDAIQRVAWLLEKRSTQSLSKSPDEAKSSALFKLFGPLALIGGLGGLALFSMGRQSALKKLGKIEAEVVEN